MNLKDLAQWVTKVMTPTSIRSKGHDLRGPLHTKTAAYLVLFGGHQEVRGSLVSREDSDGQLRVLCFMFLGIWIRHVINFLHPSVAHVDLSYWILSTEDRYPVRCNIPHSFHNTQTLVWNTRGSDWYVLKRHMPNYFQPLTLKRCLMTMILG